MDYPYYTTNPVGKSRPKYQKISVDRTDPTRGAYDRRGMTASRSFRSVCGVRRNGSRSVDIRGANHYNKPVIRRKGSSNVKRLICAMLIAFLLSAAGLLLTACGGENNDPKTDTAQRSGFGPSSEQALIDAVFGAMQNDDFDAFLKCFDKNASIAMDMTVSFVSDDNADFFPAAYEAAPDFCQGADYVIDHHPAFAGQFKKCSGGDALTDEDLEDYTDGDFDAGYADAMKKLFEAYKDDAKCFAGYRAECSQPDPRGWQVYYAELSETYGEGDDVHPVQLYFEYMKTDGGYVGIYLDTL